jgi:hypothetical protein
LVRNAPSFPTKDCINPVQTPGKLDGFSVTLGGDCPETFICKYELRHIFAFHKTQGKNNKHLLAASNSGHLLTAHFQSVPCGILVSFRQKKLLWQNPFGKCNLNKDKEVSLL